MIPIDKGVPMPDERGKKNAKYPWQQLEVGDSFIAPTASIASQASKRYAPKRFTSKKEMKGDVVMFRIWRVA